MYITGIPLGTIKSNSHGFWNHRVMDGTRLPATAIFDVYNSLCKPYNISPVAFSIALTLENKSGNLSTERLDVFTELCYTRYFGFHKLEQVEQSRWRSGESLARVIDAIIWHARRRIVFVTNKGKVGVTYIAVDKASTIADENCVDLPTE